MPGVSLSLGLRVGSLLVDRPETNEKAQVIAQQTIGIGLSDGFDVVGVQPQKVRVVPLSPNSGVPSMPRL